jgi:hypothetical protein
VTERGTNDHSLPPLNLLGAIGIPLILLAVVLQQVHLVRRRRSGEPSRPTWNPPSLSAAHAAIRDETGRRVARSSGGTPGGAIAVDATAGAPQA